MVRCGDGSDHAFEVRGAFEAVDPPRQLRYRWSDNESVDVRIEPHGGGSLLTLVHSWPETDDDRSMIGAGWTYATDALVGALRSRSVAS